jgi:hypothetical protein
MQITQTTSTIENHFYFNESKHKSILLNSLLNKINSIKLNSTKINYFHRITKHILKVDRVSFLSYLISFLTDKLSIKFFFSFQIRYST